MKFSKVQLSGFVLLMLFSTQLMGQTPDAKSEKTEKNVKEQPVIKFEPGKQVANTISVAGRNGKAREIGFWVYTPENYAEVESLPWMMFLHGMGERGDDMEKVKIWGPPKRVGEVEDFPFVLVSPQCPGDTMWQPQHLEKILDAVQEQMKVDKKRLYMTGLSMGGYGTWAMLGRFPDRIAAAVPICGGGMPTSAGRMTDVPIWAFHGDADRVVGIERSQQMVEAVNDAGGQAKLTTYEGVGHNSWSKTYANDEVYQWLLQHTTDR